jgi:hypothetical protein
MLSAFLPFRKNLVSAGIPASFMAGKTSRHGYELPIVLDG